MTSPSSAVELGYIWRLRFSLILFLLSAHGTAQAQVFVAGLGGSAALSRDASESASLVSIASYDAKVGPAFSVAAGYHFNDWLSAQVGSVWNRNLVTTTSVAGSAFVQSRQTASLLSTGADLLLYFRPRTSRIRPYLSAGPAVIHILSGNRPGLRVAVGVDVRIKSGWGVRYTFNETMSSNPFGAALSPPSSHGLMNFQNLVGVVKTF